MSSIYFNPITEKSAQLKGIFSEREATMLAWIERETISEKNLRNNLVMGLFRVNGINVPAHPYFPTTAYALSAVVPFADVMKAFGVLQDVGIFDGAQYVYDPFNGSPVVHIDINGVKSTVFAVTTLQFDGK